MRLVSCDWTKSNDTDQLCEGKSYNMRQGRKSNLNVRLGCGCRDGLWGKEEKGTVKIRRIIRLLHFPDQTTVQVAKIFFASIDEAS